MSNIPQPKKSIIIFLWLFSGFFSLIAWNLISYIVIARLLKVPRRDLEAVIRTWVENDHREAWGQNFYVWCLNIAYKQKN